MSSGNHLRRTSMFPDFSSVLRPSTCHFIESININITPFIALIYYKLGNQQLLLETPVCDHNLNC